MIIKVPIKAVNKGLTDNELVFSALMLFLARTEGKKIVFNFFSDDVKILLGHIKPGIKKSRGNISPEEYGRRYAETALTNIRQVFRIGVKNHQTWSVSFGKLEDTDCTSNGWLIDKEVAITDHTAIKTYCYIVGMVSNGTVVSNGTPKLYSKLDKKDKTLHPFFLKHFSLL